MAALPSPSSDDDLFVAFDFDETIIPCNSDTEIPRLVSQEVFDFKLTEWRSSLKGRIGFLLQRGYSFSIINDT
jgi:hypothetical protein